MSSLSQIEDQGYFNPGNFNKAQQLNTIPKFHNTKPEYLNLIKEQLCNKIGISQPI